jgi:uncharacterized membrane protein
MAEREQLEPFIKHVATQSWRTFAADPALYVLAGVIVMVVSVFSLGICVGPLTVGFLRMVMRRQRGEQASAGDVFSGFDKFLSSFFAIIVIGVAVLIGCLMLLLPGLVVALFAFFTLQVITVEGKGVFDAIGRSIDLVRQNLIESLVLLILVSALHAVGSSVLLGTLLTFPLGMIVTLVAYQRLAEREAGVVVVTPSQTF